MSSNVSIMMPVYNGGRYLKETLDLVLQQSYSDFEIVAVDDASSDDSWEILSQYAAQDKRIRLVRNEKNLGHAETCNKAISLCCGEFVARQDQDDLPMIDRLKDQVAFLQSHPEVGILGTSYFRLNSRGEKQLRTPPETHTEIRWRLLFDCVFSHSSVMYRRKIFQNGEPGYQEIPGPQDYELWTRLAKKTRMAVLNKPLLIYREPHAQSMTVLYKDQMEQAVLGISGSQIREVLSEPTITDSQVRMLRQLRSPKMNQVELEAVPLMLELFNGFAKFNDIDPEIVKRIRRSWMRRILISCSANRWKALRKTGILQKFLRIDPLVVPKSVLIDLPQKIFYKATHQKKK
jgi:glycosyltransferase involved in cell wall biosynthesis